MKFAKNKRLILAALCVVAMVVIVFVCRFTHTHNDVNESTQDTTIYAEWAETEETTEEVEEATDKPTRHPVKVETETTEETEVETDEYIEVVTSETTEQTTEAITEEVESTTEEVIETETETEAEYTLVSLGTFRLTAYCNCKKCCGVWAGGATASGVMPKSNHTIAVDTSVIPFWTEIMIDGQIYVAEDTGSGINGNCIDIYFDDHQTAWDFGTQWTEVFKVVRN